MTDIENDLEYKSELDEIVEPMKFDDFYRSAHEFIELSSGRDGRINPKISEENRNGSEEWDSMKEQIIEDYKNVSLAFACKKLEECLEVSRKRMGVIEELRKKGIGVMRGIEIREELKEKLKNNIANYENMRRAFVKIFKKIGKENGNILFRFFIEEKRICYGFYNVLPEIKFIEILPFLVAMVGFDNEMCLEILDLVVKLDGVCSDIINCYDKDGEDKIVVGRLKDYDKEYGNWVMGFKRGELESEKFFERFVGKNVHIGVIGIYFYTAIFGSRAVLTGGILDKIVKAIGGRKVLVVDGFTGYWVKCLRERGCDVRVTVLKEVMFSWVGEFEVLGIKESVEKYRECEVGVLVCGNREIIVPVDKHVKCWVIVGQFWGEESDLVDGVRVTTSVKGLLDDGFRLDLQEKMMCWYLYDFYLQVWVR